MTRYSIKKYLLIISLILGLQCLSFASGKNIPEGDTQKEKKVDPGKIIFEHIYDNYQWHIAKIGETNIAIPLVVILYSDTKGFNVFPSSKFHHGISEYEGFKIAGEGEESSGKIVEKLEDGSWKRPFLDLSITKNVLSLIISLSLLLMIFLSIAKSYERNKGQAPRGLQNALEPLIIFIRDDIAKAAIGEKRYEKYLPYLLSVFFFIFLNNLLGLVPIFPGGANLTGNISITMVLAIFSFIITTINGNRNYWKHLVNTPGVPWWLKIPIPLMPVVEIMGIFTKPFVLMVRLFANISAGHIIALGFYSLIFVFGEMNAAAGYGISVISVAFTIFMSLLELLVAFIQAYVFTLLSALYFGMAIEEHHEEHAKH
jgi:F-type H+-transporting ATPase subunit a